MERRVLGRAKGTESYFRTFEGIKCFIDASFPTFERSRERRVTSHHRRRQSLARCATPPPPPSLLVAAEEPMTVEEHLAAGSLG